MPSRDRALLLDQQLCFAMYRASRALIRAYGPLLEPLGVTYPQYLALLALWEEDAVSVKRLEQRGVVERRRDSADERVVRVLLTRKGHALQARAKSIPNALACRVADVGDRGALARISRLREELQALAVRLESDAEQVA